MRMTPHVIIPQVRYLMHATLVEYEVKHISMCESAGKKVALDHKVEVIHRADDLRNWPDIRPA